MQKRIAIAAVVSALLIYLETAHAADLNAMPAKPVIPNVVQPLPLSAVRLTGGPLKQAQDLDADYLLKLEPDRILSYFRERAGLSKKAEAYGGWEGKGRALTGHIAGHYLSAVSLMFAATGDERFKQRADYMVSQLKEVQQARKSGYIGAILGDAERRGNGAATVNDEKPLEDGEKLFDRLRAGRVESGGFDLNGMWSPWYVQHKIFAGLRDAYRYTGNTDALNVEIRFAAWCDSVVSGLNEQQTQKMLDTEFGGMSEVLVDLYADTGDQRWLKLADKFAHKSILEPLAAGKDILGGKHGNTQIPKLIGALDRFRYTGDPASGQAARFFWDTVVNHHTFATGGHGYDEYFGPPDKLSGQIDGTGQRSRDLRTAESCNVYNMLKLTRGLFALNPEARYAEFAERALFNHVLGSINSHTGEMCYMVPVGPGVSHEYQGMFDSFTCCVGTGMENHALHGEGLYFTSANAGEDGFIINGYAPSVATWAAMGVEVEMQTDMPLGESVEIRIKAGSPKAFALAIRRPSWADGDLAILLNGKPVPAMESADKSYVKLARQWQSGDTVTFKLRHRLRVEPLQANADRVALFWGPLVLASDYGAIRNRDAEKNGNEAVPVLSEKGRPSEEWLKPVDGKAGYFTATAADGRTFTLSPFYLLAGRRYGIYWDLLTAKDWIERKTSLEAADAKRRQLAAETVAFVQIGQMQPERDFSFDSDGLSIAFNTNGQPGRRGGKWMSVQIPNVPKADLKIVLTTNTDSASALKLSVNGTTVETPKVEKEGDSNLTQMLFTVPASLLKGEQRLDIRLDVAEGKELPALYGLRVTKP